MPEKKNLDTRNTETIYDAFKSLKKFDEAQNVSPDYLKLLGPDKGVEE